jgi:hypothetical protein
MRFLSHLSATVTWFLFDRGDVFVSRLLPGSWSAFALVSVLCIYYFITGFYFAPFRPSNSPGVTLYYNYTPCAFSVKNNRPLLRTACTESHPLLRTATKYSHPLLQTMFGSRVRHLTTRPKTKIFHPRGRSGGGCRRCLRVSSDRRRFISWCDKKSVFATSLQSPPGFSVPISCNTVANVCRPTFSLVRELKWTIPDVQRLHQVVMWWKFSQSNSLSFCLWQSFGIKLILCWNWEQIWLRCPLFFT